MKFGFGSGSDGGAGDRTGECEGEAGDGTGE